MQKQSVKLLVSVVFKDFYTVSFIYKEKNHPFHYYISFVFLFKKRTTWYNPNTEGPGGKIDDIRRVSESEVDPTAVPWFFFLLLLFRLWKTSGSHPCESSRWRSPTVSEFGDMLMRNQRKVNVVLLKTMRLLK